MTPFYRVFISCICFVLLIIASCANAGSYTLDVTKSIRIGIPDKWKAEKPAGLNKLLLTCPDTDANILMLSQKIGPATLDQCGSAWLKNISKLKGYKLVSKQNERVAGVPGKTFTFTTSIKTANVITTLKYVQRLTVKNKTLYAFQFVCPEPDYKECIPAFNSLFSTMRWLK